MLRLVCFALCKISPTRALFCHHVDTLSLQETVQMASTNGHPVLQLNLIQEIEVFYMLVDISLSIFSMPSLKNHTEHFNFRC